MFFWEKGNHQFRFPLICQWLQKVHHPACLHNIANDKHQTSEKLFEITQQCQNKVQGMDLICLALIFKSSFIRALRDGPIDETLPEAQRTQKLTP